jgi:hypothetical protein
MSEMSGMEIAFEGVCKRISTISRLKVLIFMNIRP